jgi:two-component system CheB/CheR fusion protein
VLIVDDEVDAAGALLDILVLEGHAARSAPDGAAALRIASEFAPEAVLLDLGMPGLDGYGVARLLRGLLGGKVLLVAMTGYDEDLLRLGQAGFDAHLLKPIDVAALLRLLAGVRTDAALPGAGVVLLHGDGRATQTAGGELGAEVAAGPRGHADRSRK